MKRAIILVVFLVILTGLGAWWFSDKQVLKRRTNSLMTTLTMDGGTGKTTRHLGAYSLNSILAPSVQLDTPTIKEANGTFERSELESAYSWLCDAAKQTRFEVVKFESITITGVEADMKLRLTGNVELPTYKPAEGEYDVTFQWKKWEDGWRLEKARWDKEK